MMQSSSADDPVYEPSVSHSDSGRRYDKRRENAQSQNQGTRKLARSVSVALDLRYTAQNEYLELGRGLVQRDGQTRQPDDLLSIHSRTRKHNLERFEIHTDLQYIPERLSARFERRSRVGGAKVDRQSDELASGATSFLRVECSAEFDQIARSGHCDLRSIDRLTPAEANALENSSGILSVERVGRGFKGRFDDGAGFVRLVENESEEVGGEVGEDARIRGSGNVVAGDSVGVESESGELPRRVRLSV